MSGASAIDSALLGGLFGTDAMREAFSDEARIRAMLRFEAALAKAEAARGVIPPESAGPIATACKNLKIDPDDLRKGTTLGGNPAIPLVKALIAATKGDAGRYVHFGATSQDAIDTGLMLQVADGLDLLLADLGHAADAASGLADAHRQTAMVGRTFLQHAVPIPFGLKAAGWLGLLARSHARLAEIRRNGLFVQFGGAAGSLSALGGKGPAVMDTLARELGLRAPDTPWHTARDRIVAIGAAVAATAGAAGKIARDVGLLMQTDTAEAFEPAAPGKGGSSTMPHKRNPVGSIAVIAAVRQAEARLPILVSSMDQDHERALGAWHAEWGAIAELFVLTAGALAHIRTILEGLTVDEKRMAANLEASDGLVYAEAVSLALAPKIGRDEAHARIEAASRTVVDEGRHLRDVLADDSQVTAYLDAKALARLFDPKNQFAGAERFISRALKAWQGARTGRSK